MVVKELLQHHFTLKNLQEELHLLLHDQVYRKRIMTDYESIIKRLGGEGASAKTAHSIIESLHQN